MSMAWGFRSKWILAVKNEGCQRQKDLKQKGKKNRNSFLSVVEEIFFQNNRKFKMFRKKFQHLKKKLTKQKSENYLELGKFS